MKLPAKIALVTLGLSALGAIVGSILGAGVTALFGMRVPANDFISVHDSRFIGLGAAFGAGMGAVLAPIAAWTLMRHVPIWRAVADTAFGTVIGAGIGLVLQPKYDAIWLSPPVLGFVGFAIAAVRLRLVKRAPAPVEH